MRILYASANHSNSSIQLLRFMEAMQNTPHTIKVSAFKDFHFLNHIDWTLDSLYVVSKPDVTSLETENFQIYLNQIKNFAPDLIITDCEYFTSSIAIHLNIPLWQYSSSLLQKAIYHKDKYKVGMFSKNLFSFWNEYFAARRNYILDNSDKIFVVSHFGDCENPPSLKDNYQWSRPYHQVGKTSKLCHHNIVVGLLKNNRQLFARIKEMEDVVVFSNFIEESYENIKLKHIRDYKEYYCNLFNSELFICQGQAQFLADAYYNNKYSLIELDHFDPEVVLNSFFSEKYGLSKIIEKDIDFDCVRDIEARYNSNIYFLHEEIMKFKRN